jgi:hypothetical protein
MQLGSRRYMQPGSELLLRAPQGTVFSAQTSHPKQLITCRGGRGGCDRSRTKPRRFGLSPKGTAQGPFRGLTRRTAEKQQK